MVSIHEQDPIEMMFLAVSNCHPRKICSLHDFPSMFINYRYFILQTDPVFIGISRREVNVRSTAFFFTKCNIDSSGVNELYSRAQDGYESTKLYAVSVVSFSCSRSSLILSLLLDDSNH